MRRTPLARRTPLRSVVRLARRTPLRAVSSRARYAEARALVHLRSGGRCELVTPVCTGRAQDCHHLLPRAQGGRDVPGNLADVCRACHDWIHAHPAASYERGWLHRREATDG